MDLQRLLANIDEYKYVTVGEYMSDAELIWQNVLEWRPDGGAVGEEQEDVLTWMDTAVHRVPVVR